MIEPQKIASQQTKAMAEMGDASIQDPSQLTLTKSIGAGAPIKIAGWGIHRGMWILRMKGGWGWEVPS